MQQNYRGDFRTQESLGKQFLHSCLGKIIIFFAIIAGMLVIAHLTIPDEESMMANMDDNIRQCIETNDSIKTDWIDDAINNIGYIFTTADSLPNKEILDNFVQYNKVEYRRHAFHSSCILYNNYHTEGISIGLGIFGMVIPTFSYKDFLIRLGPMHKGYDQNPVRSTIITGGESFGNDPELGL